MTLRVTAFWLVAVFVVYASGRCPKFGEWSNGTVTRGGPLICAKLFRENDCLGYPLVISVNSTTFDFHDPSPSMGEAGLTALLRPGCTLKLWTGQNYTGSLLQSNMETYEWKIGTDSFLSASCDCGTDNVELLTCVAEDIMMPIQVCDFYYSNIGGICSYTLMPYATYQAANGTITELKGREAEPLENALRRQVFLPTNMPKIHPLPIPERTSAYRNVTIYQRAFRCGQYRLSTPEVTYTTESYVPSPITDGQWTLIPEARKSFYVNDTSVDINTAQRLCSNLQASMTDLEEKSTRDLFARHHLNGKHYWTNWRGTSYMTFAAESFATSPTESPVDDVNGVICERAAT
jgi:hypothetical protein